MRFIEWSGTVSVVSRANNQIGEMQHWLSLSFNFSIHHWSYGSSFYSYEQIFFTPWPCCYTKEKKWHVMIACTGEKETWDILLFSVKLSNSFLSFHHWQPQVTDSRYWIWFELKNTLMGFPNYLILLHFRTYEREHFVMFSRLQLHHHFLKNCKTVRAPYP